MVDCIDVVMDILSKYEVCSYRELSNRCWNYHKLTNSEVNRAIKYLCSHGSIDSESIENPYGTKYSFYYLQGTMSSKLRKTLSYKLDLLNKHSKHTKEIGRFGEHIVGKVLENIGYDEIEYRKTQHDSIGLGRRGIDVWGEHPLNDYYQNIEVKNRVLPLGVDDIDNIQRKTSLASERWDLPVRSGLVCSFIYPKASEYAKSNDVPVVITSKQFVPEEFREFYKEYKIAFGSYYLEIVNLENPPGYLRELIENNICFYDYYDTTVDSPKGEIKSKTLEYLDDEFYAPIKNLRFLFT